LLFPLDTKILLIAVLIDLVVGDPKWLIHPTQLMGTLISFLEGKLYKRESSPSSKVFAGALLVTIVIGLTFLVGYIIVWICNLFSSTVQIIISSWILATTIAIKGLVKAGLEINNSLKRKDLISARTLVSFIVGRDTDHLSEKEIVRATVETIAENSSDGIIAPLFYAFIGGIPLALVYKSINTMDSMLGYKNEKYNYFGRVAAKLDDIANYIPARLTALLLLVAGLILRLNWRKGIYHLKSDAKKHSSPNSGWPEATVAGLLGIALGGTNYYQGLLGKMLATMSDLLFQSFSN
jgi:adenosylcobinamide-phosphate synthase